ncbi:hypothetical protein [Photobacterium leiognathi]|nr:hypothetical protein [Photobacterium leiognathi]
MADLYLCNGCGRDKDRVDNCTYCGEEICESFCDSEHYVCKECEEQ